MQQIWNRHSQSMPSACGVRRQRGRVICRSRVWSRKIAKDWNIPPRPLETLAERAERYVVYYRLNTEQLRFIHTKFVAELQRGLALHLADPHAPWDPSRCTLRMGDTYVNTELIPQGSETGSSVVVELGGIDAGTARAVKVVFAGHGNMMLSERRLSLRDQEPMLVKGLLDRRAPASMLFDAIARLLGDKLQEEEEDDDAVPPAHVGFSLGFPVEMKGIGSASLVHWTKDVETGRQTDDPVEGQDVAILLDDALKRMGVPARTSAVVNNTAGSLLTCAYENPADLPPCRMALVISDGLNGCYVQTDAMRRAYGYNGCIVNCEIGSFDQGLPVNEIDLEVDFADEANRGVQMLEKLVAARYIGEHCRRLIVKVWQERAPQRAWIRHSIPCDACIRIVADMSEDLIVTRQILRGLWEWTPPFQECRIVRDLIKAVFQRSAALSATVIVALAQQTQQRDVTCAIGGRLYSRHTFFQECLRNTMECLLPQATDYIKLYEVHDGAAKGAAILALHTSAVSP